MIRGIHHTAVSTPDMERALAFYRDLLGLVVVSDFTWPSGFSTADAITGLEDSSARVVMLRAGNAMIELFEFASPEPRPAEAGRPVCDHGITHICLDVVDVESEYRRLKDAGVVFHCEPQNLGMTIATYGRDPDGNVFELLEVVDPRSPTALNLELPPD